MLKNSKEGVKKEKIVDIFNSEAFLMYLISKEEELAECVIYTSSIYNGVFHPRNPNKYDRRVVVNGRTLVASPVDLDKYTDYFKNHSERYKDHDAPSPLFNGALEILSAADAEKAPVEVKTVNTDGYHTAYFMGRSQKESNALHLSRPINAAYARFDADESWTLDSFSAGSPEKEETSAAAEPKWLMDGRFIYQPKVSDFQWSEFDRFLSERSCRDILKMTKRIDFFPSDIQTVLESKLTGKGDKCANQNLVKASVRWYVYNGAFDKAKESFVSKVIEEDAKNQKSKVAVGGAEKKPVEYLISEELYTKIISIVMDESHKTNSDLFFGVIHSFCFDKPECANVYMPDGSVAPAFGHNLIRGGKVFEPIVINKNPYQEPYLTEYKTNESDWNQIAFLVIK